MPGHARGGIGRVARARGSRRPRADERDLVPSLQRNLRPYLSIYDPSAGSWSHRTHAGWGTINEPSYGGIARQGDRVFASDMSTALDLANGIVAFDVVLGTSQQIAAGDVIDLNLGLDGKLWALTLTGVAHSFDPATNAFLGSVSMAGSGAGVRALAVSASGDFYAATNGFVAHLAPDGTLLGTLPLSGSLLDVDIAPDGLLAIGTRVGGVWLSDTSLVSATQIGAGRWNSFVAFVPEPATGALVALGLALLAGQRRAARWRLNTMKWWRRRESNPRPHGVQPARLRA